MSAVAPAAAPWLRAYVHAPPVPAAALLFLFPACAAARLLPLGAAGRSVAAALAATSVLAVALAAPAANHLADRLARRDARAFVPGLALLVLVAAVLGAVVGTWTALRGPFAGATAVALAVVPVATAVLVAALAALGAARDAGGAVATAALATGAAALLALALGPAAPGLAPRVLGFAGGLALAAAFALVRLFRGHPASSGPDLRLARHALRRADVALGAAGLAAAPLLADGPRLALALGLATAAPGLALLLLSLEPRFHAAYRAFFAAAAAGAPLEDLRARRLAVGRALAQAAGAALALQAPIALAAIAFGPALLASLGLERAAEDAPAFRGAAAAGALLGPLLLLAGALYSLRERAGALATAATAALATPPLGPFAAFAIGAALGAALALRAARDLERRAFAREPLPEAVPPLPRFARDRS